MGSGGLAKRIWDITTATVPAARRVELKDLRHPRAANDNVELDPIDIFTEVLALGEAAPAALFLYPMWAAAAAYLKDPQYYLNKKQVTCGDSQKDEKRRPLEWAPVLNPFVPSRHDYRNPQLTDVERQKLIEWLQPEKTRGHFTGADGRPMALPQDPPRDDSYGAPDSFRNTVLDVPRPNAIPFTETALPDLQQSDDHRRLMMGDHIPGRKNIVGDMLKGDSAVQSARDFLSPVDRPSAGDDFVGPPWIADVRMSTEDDMGRRPVGPHYGDVFRANNPGLATPHPPMRALPKIAPAAPKKIDPKDRPRVAVPSMTPQSDDLHAIEDVFRHLATLCPEDERGLIDTSRLKVGHDLTVGVEFSDGHVILVQALLQRHEAALRKWSEGQGKQPPELEGGFRSERRLVDVLRRVTGRKYLLSLRQDIISKFIIKTDHRRVNFEAPDKKLTEVLRHAWENFEAIHGKMSVRAMQTSMVEGKSGERVRLQDLMVVYWQGLHAKLKSRKFDLPSDPAYHATEDGLDMIYFSLFDRVRIRMRWAGNLKAVALPFTPNEPLPEVATLKGALLVLYKLSQTSIMDGLNRFPVEPKGSLIVVYDPRTGRSFNYEKLMYSTYHMLAHAKADAHTARVFTDVVVPAEVMSNPDAAHRQFPNEETRRSLLAFVVHHQGYPDVKVSTIVRRRSGVAENRQIENLPPSGASVAARAMTEPYFSGDHRAFFPNVMMDRLKTRLTYAESLRDAQSICDDMQARGLTDASAVGRWVVRTSHQSSEGLKDALRTLPESKTLAPVVVPLVLNDMYVRLQSLLSSSSKLQRRWDARWKSDGMENLDTLSRFDRIRDFVLQEEAVLDTVPRRGFLKAWRGETTQELKLLDPWVGVSVPQVFADAMSRVLGAPDIKARAGDVSRSFMQLMPLDDVGMVQKIQGPTDTQDLLYAQLTGRPLQEWSEASLTPEQRQLREKMIGIGKTFGMIQFNDYWLGHGVKWAKQDGSIPPTLRIYLAINPAWAADALRALNEIYVGWKPNEARDVQFKMTNVPPELGRNDASLFYIDAANQGVFDQVVALHAAHPEYLRAVQGPPTTAQYLQDGKPTGISVAEAPRDVRDSRNGVISQLATRALHLYRERLVRGQRLTQAEWIQVAAHFMQSEGIDLERPAFYSGNADRKPGWVLFADIFRKTDQYNSERDDPILNPVKTAPAVIGVQRRPSDRRSSQVPRLPHDGQLKNIAHGVHRDSVLRLARTQAPLRSILLSSDTMKLPIEFLQAYQTGAIPEGEGPDGIPVGRVERVDDLTVWRLNRNVAFVRDDHAPRKNLITLHFDANEIPGYPQITQLLLLDHFRLMVRERKTAIIHTEVNDVNYHLQIVPIFEKVRGGERVSFLISPPGDVEHGTIIPWRSQWMTSPIMDDLIGAKK